MTVFEATLLLIVVNVLHVKVGKHVEPQVSEEHVHIKDENKDEEADEVAGAGVRHRVAQKVKHGSQQEGEHPQVIGLVASRSLRADEQCRAQAREKEE